MGEDSEQFNNLELAQKLQENMVQFIPGTPLDNVEEEMLRDMVRENLTRMERQTRTNLGRLSESSEDISSAVPILNTSSVLFARDENRKIDPSGEGDIESISSADLKKGIIDLMSSCGFDTHEVREGENSQNNYSQTINLFFIPPEEMQDEEEKHFFRITCTYTPSVFDMFGVISLELSKVMAKKQED